MKYPGVKIYLSKDIPEDEVYALNSSYWCDVNKKRWIRAADIFMFGEYLTPKILFKPPFKLVQAETTCLECRQQRVPVYAVEASGYVPVTGDGSDIALTLGRLLNIDLVGFTSRNVYLTNVQEYPPEFLKLIRRHSFLFRRHNLGDDNDYFANACSHCKSPIDDFQLFYEQDGILARCNPDPSKHETELAFHQPIVVECQFA
jgi:hypothetical protein